MATYYVSKSVHNGMVIGSDTNAGSLSAPWLTISKAVSTAADGDTVYVNDGTYSDLELGAASVLAVSSSKSLKIYPIVPYAVTLRSTAASAQIVSLTGTANFETVLGEFVIDGEIPGAPGTYQPTGVVFPNPSGQNVVTLSGTKIKNCSTQHVLNSKRRGTLKFLDVVFGGVMYQGVASTASGADVASMIFHIDGLALDSVQAMTNGLTRVLDVYRLSTSAQEYSLYVNRMTGSITAPVTAGASACVALVVATGIGAATNLAGTANTPLTVENCEVSVLGFSTGSTGYGVYIKNSARGATAKANAPIIRHNKFYMSQPSMYAISVGDTTTAYDVDDAVVHDNDVHVGYYLSATPHCIALGNVTGGRVYGNRTFGGYVGILAGINQGGLISGNVIKGCYGFGLYAKGCGATTAPVFANNTVYLTSTYGAARAAALGIDAQGGTNNTAVTFQNNIAYAHSDLYRYVQVGLSQVGTFVKNNYFTAGPVGFTSPWSYQASTYTTLAAWQAGQEASATGIDPSFPASGSLTLGHSTALRRGGTWISGAIVDARGRISWIPPDVGAFQMSAGDMSTPRVARS